MHATSNNNNACFNDYEYMIRLNVNNNEYYCSNSLPALTNAASQYITEIDLKTQSSLTTKFSAYSIV